MSFQFIWAICMRLPPDHILNTINKPRFDFIFFDKRPFIGTGIRITSIIPITLFPLFFNSILPVSLSYYFTLTSLVFLGDLLGSILKRRLGYQKGEFAFLIDHGDYILTTGIVFTLLNHISLQVFLYSLLITYILHPITCFIGYKLGIKKEPF